MKKIKKIMAMLLAMVMVLGMTVTAMATPNSATITVNNLDAQATVKSIQVIAPDSTKDTGWEFINGAENAYLEAFGNLENNEANRQLVLKKLINYQATLKNPSGELPYKGMGVATAGQIKDALGKINNHVNTDVNDNIITVSSAGVYAIKVTTEDQKYVYSDMAAYVKFGEYDQTTGIPSALENAIVNAKKTSLEVEKKNDTVDDVVSINDEVTYTVTTTIPYVADDIIVGEKYLTLTDTISGAEYKRNDSNQVFVKSIKLGGTNYTGTLDFLITEGEGSESFTVDLSDIAKNRENANKVLEIQYVAIVKGEVVDNKVNLEDGNHTFTPGTNHVYTGKVTMTKTGEDQEKLANAGFAVYRMKDSVKEYATVRNDKDNEYVVSGWEQVEEFNDENRDKYMVVTDDKGEVIVRGLDSSVEYKFEEIQAPEGYSINETDSVVVWNMQTTADKRTGTANMTDTKLSSLPETGGIGTTIFTIGGCAIMVAAAGLFFASRRKANK